MKVDSKTFELFYDSQSSGDNGLDKPCVIVGYKEHYIPVSLLELCEAYTEVVDHYTVADELREVAKQLEAQLESDMEVNPQRTH